MIKATLLFIVTVTLSSISGNAQKNSGPAQVTLQNNTQYDLCLYVDNENNLACGPASGSGGICVASVESGSHVFIVATVGGKISASTDPVDLNSGDSKIITVAIGNDGQLMLSIN
ncbi:MAG: hypothetical protein WAO19_00310 [Candidatus Kryptoniota bacterium]